MVRFSRGVIIGIAALLVSSFLFIGSPPAHAADNSSAIGVYKGGRNIAGVKNFEAWSGRPVRYVLDYLEDATWQHIANPDWVLDPNYGWPSTDYRLSLSVPLLPESGGTLALGASGAYNAHFQSLASLLVSRGMENTIIRLGWEFNGSWYRWNAAADPSSFVSYWRQVVTSMRSVSGQQFLFDWSPAVNQGQLSTATVYPGDDVVDIIGVDVYDQGWSSGWRDPEKRWQQLAYGTEGLQWYRDFALAHNKGTSFPEWGMAIRSDGHGGGDNAYFMNQMAAWINSQPNLIYAAYFDFDNPGERHCLSCSNTAFPIAAQHFLNAFGNRPIKQVQRVGDNSIAGFGPVNFFGSLQTIPSNSPVGIASTPTGNGYWMVASDGGIFAFGDATFFGSMGGSKLNQPIVGIASTPTGNGYWMVASDGGIFSFGDTAFFGSMGGTKLNQPIVGIASTPTGNGYWMVASDGGIFAFGDAKFFGSMGGSKLNKPIVGIASTPTGNGYWMVASDGGIFSFGDAKFFGSMGGTKLNKPIVGIASTPTGDGYWMAASDGGIFAFGDAKFFGSREFTTSSVRGISSSVTGGYWVFTNN